MEKLKFLKHPPLPPLTFTLCCSQAVQRSQLDRILLSCNRLLRGSGAWRAHEAYLNGVAVLRTLVPIRELWLSYVPLLKQEVLTAVRFFSFRLFKN
jgi:hypothetical protein